LQGTMEGISELHVMAVVPTRGCKVEHSWMARIFQDGEELRCGNTSERPDCNFKCL